MIIERYDSRIAATVMADFILLGHQNVGSFALADNKTNLFSVAMGAFLDIICDVFNNQAIPKLINMNADHFKGITDYPKMIHSDIEGPDLPALSTFVKDMVGVGVLTPDESIEDFLRRTANLPDKVDGGGYYPANGSQQHEHKRSEVNPKEDEEDQKEAAKAKQELKRKEKQTDNSKTTEKEQ
jgi:hypothetical protein